MSGKEISEARSVAEMTNGSQQWYIGEVWPISGTVVDTIRFGAVEGRGCAGMSGQRGFGGAVEALG